MKSTEIFALLAAVHKHTPFRIKPNGSKCWKHRGHVIEVGPSVLDHTDFSIKRNLTIDGKKVEVKWEEAVDYSLLANRMSTRKA